MPASQEHIGSGVGADASTIETGVELHSARGITFAVRGGDCQRGDHTVEAKHLEQTTFGTLQRGVTEALA